MGYAQTFCLMFDTMLTHHGRMADESYGGFAACAATRQQMGLLNRATNLSVCLGWGGLLARIRHPWLDPPKSQ
jgi:hypothetical protein